MVKRKQGELFYTRSGIGRNGISPKAAAKTLALMSGGGMKNINQLHAHLTADGISVKIKNWKDNNMQVIVENHKGACIRWQSCADFQDVPKEKMAVDTFLIECERTIRGDYAHLKDLPYDPEQKDGMDMEMINKGNMEAKGGPCKKCGCTSWIQRIVKWVFKDKCPKGGEE